MSMKENITARPASARGRLARQMLAGGVVCVFLFGGLGGWAATTKLDGAIMARGQLVVDGNVKLVQHRDGGIVSSILVRDGQRVRAGDVILKLDETVPKANLAIVETQMVDLTAMRHRLQAEQLGADRLVTDAASEPRLVALVDELKNAYAAETTLFEARRTTIAGQKASLGEEITQIEAATRGLEAKLAATHDQLTYIGDEMKSAEALQAKGLTTLRQISELRRARADLTGTIGQLGTDIAQSNISVSQTHLKILQLDHDRRAQVETDLRDVTAKLAEFSERRAAAQDQLNRVVVRAPQDGVVDQLAVHTVGGVIGAGETIAQIVPDDRLIVQARIRPMDIDHVVSGQAARIRIQALDQRYDSDLEGTVQTVSADVATDPATREAYYLVRILISDKASAQPRRPLLPGMPAEIFLKTGSRTALDYLLKPLSEQIAHAMRET